MRTRLALVVLGVAALVACFRPVPIAEVHQRSQLLMGKPVIVAGRVVRALDLPLLRDHFYELDDGTGQIWVQSSQPTPTEGQTVRVTGTLGARHQDRRQPGRAADRRAAP